MANQSTHRSVLSSQIGQIRRLLSNCSQPIGSLSLTEEGEKEWKSIVALLLEHCRLIAQEPDLQRHWEESRKLSEISFNHSSPGQAYDTSPNLAQSIVVYGTECCQSAGRLVDQDARAAQEFASFLKAENCIVERCSEAAWEEMEAVTDYGSTFGKKTEPWYGIDYYLLPIVDYSSWSEMTPTALLDPSNLHLPNVNRFIPRSLELVDELPDEAKQGPRIEREINTSIVIRSDPNRRTPIRTLSLRSSASNIRSRRY